MTADSNVVIFGAADKGLRVKRDLESKGMRVRYFCDNNLKKTGNKLDGIDILSFEQMIEKCKGGIYSEDIEEIVIATNEPDSIMEQIRKSSVHIKCYGLSYEYLHGNRQEFQSVNDFVYSIDIDKPRLEYYEYHISYHCNLKCKGCGHYSNIVPKEFGDLEQYKKDMTRLRELYAGVKRIRLMGGEPLLNPQLAEFCRVSRRAFPDANIRVVTNGLLIPTIDEKLLQVMRDYYIGFDITQYPPTAGIKEKIELICIENDIVYTLSEPVTQFFYITNPSGDSDPLEEFEICVSRGCHCLENGKISVCAVPILNKKYENMVEVKIAVCDEDIIDIYEETLNGFELNQFLERPIESCRYCSNTRKQWFDWRGNFTELIESNC